MKIAIDKNACSQRYYELIRLAFNDFKKGENVKMLELTPVSYLRIVKSKEEVKGIEESLKLESAALISFYAKLQHLILIE
jgi:hypothetical protein